ncbi:quinol monooxygenase YgiN [Pseudoduganella lurida]|uniref:Quinol monooxygenase YgiN n=1 Tax=Pseudoduganella lurida TaxID=1036180 RepID=A0A562R0S0_9BURK|nr:putative quinol monooxygenase [Pseudoduganella lurida]TWI62174.1 quinol monooxygenase YgiN [Pseudoduganella lurida]
MTQLLTVVATITARPGQEAAVRQALETVVPGSRAEAGCRRYELHVDNEQPGRFVMLEEWDSAAALAEHEATDHFKALGAAVRGLVDIRIDKLTKIA